MDTYCFDVISRLVEHLAEDEQACIINVGASTQVDFTTVLKQKITWLYLKLHISLSIKDPDV